MVKANGYTTKWLKKDIGDVPFAEKIKWHKER